MKRYTLNQIMAHVSRRFNLSAMERASLCSSRFAIAVATWAKEYIEIRDPPPRQLIVKEGEDATIQLINKDGSTSTFRVEATSHRLWMMEE